MPLQDTQLKHLILTLNTSPSSKFAHVIRYLPPSISQRLPLPASAANPDGLPFTRALRYLYLRTLSKILQIPFKALTSTDPSLSAPIQVLMPSTHGGVGREDPALLAPAAFLASLADTHALHAAHPFLAPHVSDFANWHASPSPVLADGASCFTALTSYPSFSLTNPTTYTRTVATLLIGADGTYQLSHLPAIAHRHAQRAFSAAIFDRIAATCLAPTSPLSAHARVSWNASMAPGATVIFNTWSIPPALKLNHKEFLTLIAHRLCLPLPYLPQPPNSPRHCHGRCPFYKPGQALIPVELRALCNHQMNCSVGGAAGMTVTTRRSTS